MRTLTPNTIQIKFFDKLCVALMDTGCGTSVVSKQLARKLNLDVLPLSYDDSFVLYGADGNPINVLGKTQLAIKLGGNDHALRIPRM